MKDLVIMGGEGVRGLCGTEENKIKIKNTKRKI